MIESLACGTPVIGYAVGGLPDLVRLNESGILVPPKDSAALAGALEMLLRSGGADLLRESSRRIAVENCSYEAHAGACSTLYASLLSGANGVPPAPPADYDSPLWDASIKLLVDRLEMRPGVSREEKVSILAARLEINRLLAPPLQIPESGK